MSPVSLVGVQSAAEDGIAHGHRHLHIGAEAVGGIAAHGEPAGRIQQERKIRVDGGELDAVDRRILLAVERAVVSETHGGEFALDQRLIELHPDGEILLVAGGLQLLALVVHHAPQSQCVVQLEGGRGDAFIQREEVQGGGGRDSRGIGRDFGVDQIVLDFDPGTAILGERSQRPGENQQDTNALTKHEQLLPPISPAQ